jgi:hypothetical protein
LRPGPALEGTSCAYFLMECIGVIEFVTPVFLFVAVRFFLCGDFQLYVSEVAALRCNYHFLRRLFDAIAVGFGCSGRRGGRRQAYGTATRPQVVIVAKFGG